LCVISSQSFQKEFIRKDETFSTKMNTNNELFIPNNSENIILDLFQNVTS